MKQYLDLIQDILDHGVVRNDRTGVGTHSVFGRQLRFDLRDGFPAVTTKKLAWKSVVSELLWFLEGSTNEHRLAEIKNDNKPYDQLTEQERHTIWTANFEKQGVDLGYKDGELGPIYGHQWRHWDIVKQFAYNQAYRDFIYNFDKIGNAFLVPQKTYENTEQTIDVIGDVTLNIMKNFGFAPLAPIQVIEINPNGLYESFLAGKEIKTELVSSNAQFHFEKAKRETVYSYYKN